MELEEQHRTPSIDYNILSTYTLRRARHNLTEAHHV